MGLREIKTSVDPQTDDTVEESPESSATATATSVLDPETAALLDRVNPVDGAPAVDDSRHAALFESAEASTEEAGAASGVRLVGEEQSESAGIEFESIVRQKVLAAIKEHGEETPDIEVCGILVGSVYQNADAGFVYIEDIIRGHGANGRNSAVTFTAETWTYIEKQMDEHHRGKRIVGWYHTHPGFGIFLSGMDKFIQDHFFNAPWQTALVYDPQSQQKGMFAWREGKTTRVDFVVDDGTGPSGASRATSPAPVEPTEGSTEDPVAAAPGSVGDLGHKLDLIERRQRTLLIAIAVLALVALVWPLVVLFVVPDLRKPPTGSPNGVEKPVLPIIPDMPQTPGRKAADGTSGNSAD